MAYLISASPESRYQSFGCNSVNANKDLISSYQPVNIYNVNSSGVESEDKKSTFDMFRRWCCFCCGATSNDVNDSVMDDPNSSLAGHIGRSYTLNAENTAVQRVTPTVTVTRVIENDCTSTKFTDDASIKSTTTLLITSEQEASAISLSKIKAKRRKSRDNDSGNNSQSSTLKTGEKVSFIREVLACRDSFLRSLEWCDNSLTRGKKYRYIKRDDWLEIENGTQKS